MSRYPFIAVILMGLLSTSCEKEGISDADAKKIANAMVEAQQEAAKEQLDQLKINQIKMTCVMAVRDCQQVLRGEQNLKNLKAGDPFTKADLEKHMLFPPDIKIPEGVITFKAGTVVPPDPSNRVKDDSHLWLKIIAPETKGNVGKYGFNDILDTADW